IGAPKFRSISRMRDEAPGNHDGARKSWGDSAASALAGSPDAISTIHRIGPNARLSLALNRSDPKENSGFSDRSSPLNKPGMAVALAVMRSRSQRKEVKPDG
ncbi:MAG TPA: hypothetical protein VIW92_01765, partial [Thermoanaerobaculia bacterium]